MTRFRKTALSATLAATIAFPALSRAQDTASQPKSGTTIEADSTGQRSDIDERAAFVSGSLKDLSMFAAYRSVQSPFFGSSDAAGLGATYDSRLGDISAAVRLTTIDDLAGQKTKTALFGARFDGERLAATAIVGQSATRSPLFVDAGYRFGPFFVRANWRHDITPADATSPRDLLRPLPRTVFFGSPLQTSGDKPMLDWDTPMSAIGIGGSYAGGHDTIMLDVLSGDESYLGIGEPARFSALRIEHDREGAALRAQEIVELNTIADGLTDARVLLDLEASVRLFKAGFTGYFNGSGTSMADLLHAYTTTGGGLRVQPRFGPVAVGPFATYEDDQTVPRKRTQAGFAIDIKDRYRFLAGATRIEEDYPRFLVKRGGHFLSFSVPLKAYRLEGVIGTDEKRDSGGTYGSLSLKISQ